MSQAGNQMNIHRKSVALSAAIAVTGGLIVTYATGFFRPLFPFRTVDVLEWGSPFPYLTRIAGAGGLPKHLDWTNAVVDFLIWAIIIFVASLFIMERKGKAPVRTEPPGSL